MTDQPALTPIKPERLAREVRELCTEHRDGRMKDLVFEQRFARMIGELRDRRVDGNRQEINAALEPLRLDGIVPPREWDRLMKSLGLA